MKRKPKKKLPVKEEIKYIWAIAYINRDFLEIVESELVRYGYEIETYIPTVKVIKKKFKGKNIFEFVPLLFNYGFFKVKYEDACNPEYLLVLRSRISCIYGWVKDPAGNMKHNVSLRSGNKESHKALPGSAFATDKEISDMIKTSDDINVYSADELSRFNKGDYINLKGYPFDDVPAEIIEINYKKKEIQVSLLLDALVKEVTVSFENVFYTVYQGYDESLSKDSNIDEMESRSNSSCSSDRLMFKNTYYEEGE